MTRKFLAEFMGTFALTFVGAGSIIVTSGENLIVIALAHGIILAVMIASMMHVSGAQFNPAVSIALAVRGLQPWSQALWFTAFQVVGGIAAAFLLKATMVPAFEYANTHLGETFGIYSGAQGVDMISAWRVLVLEGLAAFFLMWVIMGVAVDQKNKQHAGIAALAIGGVVIADILCFGTLTGASMNPAKSFGPALVSGEWTLHWCYWVGPIVGAMIAAIVYDKTITTQD
jgi:MIP family channel proteins|tara:strand:- start:30 stop:716 length:687 start_codon:yes stop_codon:yes gene_type:complete